MALDYPDWTDTQATATSMTLDFPDWTDAFSTVASTSGDTPDWTRLGVQVVPASPYDAKLASYSPYLWWKLNDAAGTNPVADSGSAGITGAVTPNGGTVTLGSPGIIPGNTAALFAGTAPLIYNTTAYTTLTVTPLTVIAWVNFTSLIPAYSCVVQGATPTYHGWRVYVKSNGKLAVSYLNDSGAGINQDGTGTAVLGTGTNYMIAFTYDGATLYSYVNGTQDISVNQFVANATNVNIAVADDLSGTHYNVAGTIAEVALIKSILSQSQLAKLYAAV